ncbi:MAG: hypothetical protein HOH24_08530 [Chromatiales bacterium]|jgi:hypothetical protein|nr:hypothetical protein [Chromatiales bacterium]
MVSNDPIRLFIAHTFVEHDDFCKVVEYIQSKDSFFYVNTASLIKPGGGDKAAHEELRKQIGLAEIVIVPVNIYKANPGLVDYQLRVAENFGLKVLALRPFGIDAELPRELRNCCAEVVEWESRRIINSIKKLARNEHIPEYEVVEFTLE